MADEGPERVSLAVCYPVIIVDRELATHDLGRRLLHPDPRLEVVGGSLSTAAGLQLAAEVAPDVIILDPEVPGDLGSARIVDFREAAPEASIVLFSAVVPDPLPAAVDRAVSKSDPAALLPALRAVLDLSPPDELDERCPACEGTLLVVAVLLEAGEREVVCASCRRVFRADSSRLTERGVLE